MQRPPVPHPPLQRAQLAAPTHPGWRSSSSSSIVVASSTPSSSAPAAAPPPDPRLGERVGPRPPARGLFVADGTPLPPLARRPHAHPRGGGRRFLCLAFHALPPHQPDLLVRDHRSPREACPTRQQGGRTGKNSCRRPAKVIVADQPTGSLPASFSVLLAKYGLAVRFGPCDQVPRGLNLLAKTHAGHTGSAAGTAGHFRHEGAEERGQPHETRYSCCGCSGRRCCDRRSAGCVDRC